MSCTRLRIAALADTDKWHLRARLNRNAAVGLTAVPGAIPDRTPASQAKPEHARLLGLSGFGGTPGLQRMTVLRTFLEAATIAAPAARPAETVG